MRGDDITFPVRINRYLFMQGICSRRQADRYIEQGLVHVNGKPAVVGQQINEKDEVAVADAIITARENFEYLLFNKPRGVVSHNPGPGEKSVEHFLPKSARLFPVGRLDKASEGLMLLTDDTRIVHALLNPESGHEREYKVKVDKEIKERDLRRMAKGVDIEGYFTKPAKTKKLGTKIFSITLTEGKKHQIRRMCAALGYQVRELKRMRMEHLYLGPLPNGKSRPLTFPEKKRLLERVGLM
jgi:23S rRNA pseudouridine2604 synthase